MIQFDLEKQKEIRVVGSYLLLFHLAEAKLGRKTAGNPLGERIGTPLDVSQEIRGLPPRISAKNWVF